MLIAYCFSDEYNKVGSIILDNGNRNGNCVGNCFHNKLGNGNGNRNVNENSKYMYQPAIVVHSSQIYISTTRLYKFSQASCFHTVTLSQCHISMLQCHNVTMSHCRTITPFILSHHHPVTQLKCPKPKFVMLHCHTVTLSHCLSYQTKPCGLMDQLHMQFP